MRVIGPALAVGLLCASAAAAEDAPPGPLPLESVAPPPANDGDQSGLDLNFPTTSWVFTADAMLLQIGEDNLVVGQLSPTSGAAATTFLNTTDAGWGMEPGVRLSLLHRVDERDVWELVYFGLQSWSGGRTIYPNPTGANPTLATSGYTQIDKFIGGFDTSLGFGQTARLENVEVNLRDTAETESDSFGTFFGIRYMQWDETFNLTGVDTFYADTEQIDTEAHNYMVGPQIGAALQRGWDRLQFRAVAKIGLLANFAEERRSNLASTINPASPGAAQFASFDQANASFSATMVWDFSFLGTYQWTPHLAIHGGYQLLFLSGMALGPDQVANFDQTANLFLHGPTAGVEYRW
jgi:hypothetical protein